MSRYEGLSLPELMDLLHGIILPEPVSWLPQTQGWRVAGAWLLAVAVIGSWHWIAYRRRNRYRRDAQAELSAIADEAATTPAIAAARICSLLKRTALAVYPRQAVASLYGADWARFLAESSRGDAVVSNAADALAGGAYRADADGRALIEPARRWIRVHRA